MLFTRIRREYQSKDKIKYPAVIRKKSEGQQKQKETKNGFTIKESQIRRRWYKGKKKSDFGQQQSSCSSSTIL